jgi:hypothetical protein
VVIEFIEILSDRSDQLAVKRFYRTVNPIETKGFFNRIVVQNAFLPDDLCGNTNRISLAVSKLSASHVRHSSRLSKYLILFSAVITGHSR